MARTFIGELVLRLKDQMSGEAKKAAANLDTSIDRIQRAARQLNATSWGGQFEQRLQKLGASSADLDKLRVAWEKLEASISSRNLGKALANAEKSNFKTAALGYFSDIATKAKDAETNIGNMHARWKEAAKDMAVYGTIGTIMYGGARAVREGIVSNADLMREKSRWKDANIPDAERDTAIAESDRLTTQYPSAGLLNIVELARKARAMMGDNDRGLAILPDLTKAFVALQSAKGTDAAVQELEGFLKGADVAGLNAPGQKGVDSIRSVIAGWVRAAQVEGRDLDTGKFLEFARYGKLAVPGLSDRFLSGTVPAITQDYGPSQFGTALNMAYKAFVIGSNSVAGKKNLQAQRDLGIRVGDGKGQLVDDQLFGTDPYAWVNKVLIPALQKNGVDTENNVAVSKAIAELSSNSNAATVLTRMVTQKAQIDRLLQQYDAAKGLESADTAATQDPFVAWKGFIESWRELAAQIRGMPEAVAGLNTLTAGLQRFATALRENDGGAQALLAGGGLVAGFATWKVAAGIYGLITAGTNLNAAAASLELAAASLAAGGGKGNLVDEAVDSAKKNGGWLATIGAFFKAARAAAITAVPALAADSIGTTPGDSIEEMRRNQYMFANDMRRLFGMELVDESNRSGSPDDRDERNKRLVSPYEPATEAMDRRKAFEADTAPRGNTPGLGDIFKPQVDLGDANAAATEASRIGGEIQGALNVSARPSVDNGSLQETLRLVNAIKAGLAGIGGAVQQARASVAGQMNRNFADHGVKP